MLTDIFRCLNNNIWITFNNHSFDSPPIWFFFTEMDLDPMLGLPRGSHKLASIITKMISHFSDVSPTATLSDLNTSFIISYAMNFAIKNKCHIIILSIPNVPDVL
tara:strand:- start:3246 stop:3560 length:315 start_codon:yes stop_codon:yes gene_type:complete